MRRLAMCELVLVIVAACSGGGGGEGGSDAGTTQPDAGRPPCNPPSPICGTGDACGNNQIDSCWYQLMPGHCYYLPGGLEQCDGTESLTSCTQLGYYGGTSTCTATCTENYAGCDACAPGNVACDSFAPLTFARGMATSGSRVAILNDMTIAIYEGATEIIRSSVPYAQDLAAVPGGWLVSTDTPALVFVSSAGAVGTEKALPEEATGTQLASGPSDRVIVVWKHFTANEWHVSFAIADSDGDTVVAATELFLSTANAEISVTSDGTSFFVGSGGQLARITTTGTATIATGFPAPTEDDVTVTWSGTTGWYIGGDTTDTGQRFDANGAKVGAPFTINLAGVAYAYVADGADLLALRSATTSPKLDLVRINANLVMSIVGEVGVGAQEAWVARVGSEYVVAWTRGAVALQVAVVSP